jgi:peptidoglycan/LPS O-acetylase OafA/YrhL
MSPRIIQVRAQYHRSFFAWRGFPLIWAITLSLPIVQHYHYILHFWHIAGLVQVSALPLFNLGIILCIQNAITAPPRLLNIPIVIWIGNLSYSLYLWQMPFTNPGVRSWATTFPQNAALTLMAAMISYYALEQPIRKFGEHRARPKPPLAVPAASRETSDLLGRAA